MNPSNRLKCLFGFHKYDEVWQAGHRSTLTICVRCRTVAQYIHTNRPSLADVVLNVQILTDNQIRFVIRSLTGNVYSFRKKSYRSLDSVVVVCNGPKLK